VTPDEHGFLLGILVGEGSFGGDGKQPQVSVRMHERHEQMFKRLESLIEGSKLYGPYHHSNRAYYQWMVRGEPLKALIREGFFDPIEQWDAYAWERFQTMCVKYRIKRD